MKRASGVLLLGFFLLLSTCVQRSQYDSGFAVPKQAGSHVARQRAGLDIHTSAAGSVDVIVARKGGDWVHTPGQVLEPTQEEWKLAALLKDRGEQRNGQWQKLLANYTGSNPVVLGAAMHAAIKQREYEEGLKIYRRLRCMTVAEFSIAMKLLGKLGRFDEVEQLWGQLVELDLVNQVLAAVRIDAAADAGDIQGAEAVLDYMVKNSMEAGVVHFTSAIKACANAKDTGRAQKAQLFFDRMVGKGIEPNVVTYANLLRAFRDESSQRCLLLLRDMKNRNVKPNRIFAESFLFIFLKSPLDSRCWRTLKEIIADLKKLDLSDLQAAKRFIDELRDANVKMSKSSKLIDVAIKSILRKQFVHSFS